MSSGHKTMDCTENRKLDQNDIPDKLPEEAWAMMKKASDEKDLEDFREVSLPGLDTPAPSLLTQTGFQNLFQGCPNGELRRHREKDACG